MADDAAVARAREAPTRSPCAPDGIADIAACAIKAMMRAEQVDARSGRPVWVVLLVRSHAFSVLACRPDQREP